MPSPIAELRDLIERGSAADRAFADGVIRMQRGEGGGPLDALHPLLRERALVVHAELRARILDGLRGYALRVVFEMAAERDHFVEEVLGIAYPPLDEVTPGPEQIPYLPSGYDEILHAFETTGLAEGNVFVDLGSGLGKAVMLAELLVGAKAEGVELDRGLCGEALRAARALGLGARFTEGDARTAPLAEADVLFMYLPFTGSVLDAVLQRVGERRPRFLCAGSLDLTRRPWLRPVGEGRSWLQVYAVGRGRALAPQGV